MFDKILNTSLIYQIFPEKLKNIHHDFDISNSVKYLISQHN